MTRTSGAGVPWTGGGSEQVQEVEPGASNGYAGGRTLDTRVKVVERFEGPRLRHRASFLRRLRSAVLLIVIGLVLAGTLASVLGAGIWGLSIAIHHASTG